MRTGIIVILLCSLLGCGGMKDWIHPDVDKTFTGQTFTAQQLQQDLDYLVATMSRGHPAFEQYVDSEQFSAQVERLSAQLKDNMTRKQAFAVLGQLTPYFNDGHSILFPLLAEFTYAEEAGIQTFPFGVNVRDGKIRLARAYQRRGDQKTLAAGSEIVSINGHAASEIIARLTPMSHGESPALRESMLSLLFHYWLFAVFDVKGDIQLALKDNSKTTTLTLLNDQHWERAGAGQEDNELTFITPQVAYLRVESFDVDTEQGAYDAFINESFKQIRQQKAQTLIIDIRGNTGGQSDAGAQIIQYLTDKPVPQGFVAIEKLNSDTIGWFGYRGEPGEVIELSVESDGMIEPVAPSLQFKGDVWGVIDRMSYSAAILFATTIQDNQLGKLMGEPTGGYANQTGNLTPFYLPNTRLLMLAPGRYIVRPSGNKAKQPVMPDVRLTDDALADPLTWLKTYPLPPA
ncbi:MAG: hypothetical protein CBB67_012230 [Alteromonadaceae bacterium TMED7]|nr:hypothetical protein [Alteromonadaceae bacterium]MCP4866056.1 hypothetical protein [Alteromonas sp.]RPH17885.1 MAG: hypothetical protein CBB67_012230 [Alteromonadaceae bacterium TMED7]|tara:strand:+ start:2279 stop:3655 length:1377 start_codon:yes stop_codon:yes gene_type:complete